MTHQVKWFARKTRFSPARHTRYGTGKFVFQVHRGANPTLTNQAFWEGLVAANSRKEAIDKATVDYLNS